MRSGPSQGTAVPSVAQNGCDHVVAVYQEFSDIVSLVKDAFAIVSKFRRENAVSDAAAVQEDAVTAQRGHVQPRTLHVLC